MTFAARPTGATVLLLGCAFFPGCTPTVQIGPRDLRGIVASDFQHPVAEKTESPCDPNEPPPIPETVHISIDPGKPVQADQGGEALLRAYIAQREWAQRILR